MTIPRVVLVLTGVVFLSLGLLFLADPVGTIALVGIGVDNARAGIEVRAMYGGLELGLGAFFLVAAVRERWIRAGLGAQILSLGGLALGRAVGLALDGQPDRLMLGLLLAELAGAGIGVTAFRHAREYLVNNRFERRSLD